MHQHARTSSVKLASQFLFIIWFLPLFTTKWIKCLGSLQHLSTEGMVPISITTKFSSILLHQLSGNKKALRILQSLRQSLTGIKVSKHGTNTLRLPRRLFYTDLTVYMDFEANPGPEVSRNDKIRQLISTSHNVPVNYSSSQLLNLRTK